MKRLLALVALLLAIAAPAAHAGVEDGGSSTTENGDVIVGIVVTTPGAVTPGHPADGGDAPLIRYTISWSIDPVAAQTGSLNGLCIVPGAATPTFGYEYHLIGTDATGTVVDDRFVCIALPTPGDPTQRPALPPVPAVPTFAEAWNAAQLPPPAIVLDPATRGITGLDTRITTTGPTELVIAATVRGYTITGTATLDHYTVAVDGETATSVGATGGTAHYMFERKGMHLVTVGSVWHGTATISGADLAGTTPPIDLGDATVTSTRPYRVNEIRSVLQP